MLLAGTVTRLILVMGLLHSLKITVTVMVTVIMRVQAYINLGLCYALVLIYRLFIYSHKCDSVMWSWCNFETENCALLVSHILDLEQLGLGLEVYRLGLSLSTISTSLLLNRTKYKKAFVFLAFTFKPHF